MTERILVIKLGALGDFLFALGPMQAIRRHHPEAELVLLTRPAYRDLASSSGLFDEIWDDTAPRFNPLAWLALARRLRGGGFSRVYDLQTSDRSAAYFRMFRGTSMPEWSGKVRGASHRHVYPEPHRLHTVDRQRAQLAVAGVAPVGLSDLGFLDADVSALVPADPFAALIPGASPERPAKRWPVEHYASVARRLAERGLIPVVIGGSGERGFATDISAAEPSSIDLTGRTVLGDLAAIARRCTLAIGNDTGPTHLMALAGAPTLALFSADSDPERTGPRGPATRHLQRDPLADLGVDAVVEAVEDWLPTKRESQT